MKENVNLLNHINLKTVDGFNELLNSFSLDEILLALKNKEYRSVFVNHYTLILLIQKLLDTNSIKTLNTIFSDAFLKRYFKNNFQLFSSFIKGLDYDTSYKLLTLLDDLKIYNKASEDMFNFLTRVDTDILNRILCSNLSSSMIKFIYCYCNNLEVRQYFIINNDRNIFDYDELVREAYRNNLVINSRMRINFDVLNHVNNNDSNVDKKTLLDEIDLRKKMFKKYVPLIENNPKKDVLSYLVSPDMIDELPKTVNRISYLQQQTNIKLTELIIDELFHDNYYRVIGNITELLGFYLNNKGLKFNQNHIKIYTNILKLDEMDLKDKLKIYNMYFGLDLCTMLCNDLAFINGINYRSFNEMLEKLDDRCYSNSLSRKNNCNVYDYRHDKYAMLVRVTDEPFIQSSSDEAVDNYQLINNKRNIHGFSDDKFIYGYTWVDTKLIMSTEDKTDIIEWYDNRSSSNIMSNFVLPKELLLASKDYDDIDVSNCVINGSYQHMVPSYIVCYDNINEQSISESKRLGIPIVLIKTNRKLKVVDQVFKDEYKTKKGLKKVV